jgi:hypothetical protein
LVLSLTFSIGTEYVGVSVAVGVLVDPAAGVFSGLAVFVVRGAWADNVMATTVAACSSRLAPLVGPGRLQALRARIYTLNRMEIPLNRIPNLPFRQESARSGA